MKIFLKVLTTIWGIQFIGFFITLIVGGICYGYHSRTPYWVNAWGMIGLICPICIATAIGVFLAIREIWRNKI